MARNKDGYKNILLVPLGFNFNNCNVPFEIWNATVKRRDILDVIAINGNIVGGLKCNGYRIQAKTK
jgi:hypothetical protein